MGRAHCSVVLTGRREDPWTQKTLESAGVMVADLLTQRGIEGSFVLLPVGQSPTKAPGVRVMRVDSLKRELRVTVQPGHTDTGWKYDLRLPAECAFSPEEIAQKLGEKPASKNGEEGAAQASEQPGSQRLSPTEFGRDMELAMLACEKAFRLRPTPALAELVASVREEFGWTIEQGQQGIRSMRVNGLVAPIKGNSEQLYEIVSPEFRTLLIEYGMIAPQAEPEPEIEVAPVIETPAPTPIEEPVAEAPKPPVAVPVVEARPHSVVVPPGASKAVLREAVTEMVDGVPVRKIPEAPRDLPRKPVPVAKPAKVPRVLKTKPAAAPVADVGNAAMNVAAELERLEKLSSRFIEAQRLLTSDENEREGLQQAVLSAERTLQNAIDRLSAFDRREGEALKILQDPQYMEAAGQLSRIKTILNV